MSPNDPEQVFENAFRRMKPGLEPPSFVVRFRPYAKLRSRVRFDRGSGCILADLSDLTRDAPPRVLAALATMLLGRLYRAPVSRRATRVYSRWLRTPETQARMLDARRARGRKQLLPPLGRAHDLEGLFDRLNRLHFGGSLRKPALGWSPQPARKQLGHYDPAHDAIAINPVLDSPEVPPLAVEYVLFHEMLHVKHPAELRRSGRCVHTREFLDEERRFPRLEEALGILRSLHGGGR